MLVVVHPAAAVESTRPSAPRRRLVAGVAEPAIWSVFAVTLAVTLATLPTTFPPTLPVTDPTAPVTLPTAPVTDPTAPVTLPTAPLTLATTWSTSMFVDERLTAVVGLPIFAQ